MIIKSQHDDKKRPGDHLWHLDVHLQHGHLCHDVPHIEGGHSVDVVVDYENVTMIFIFYIIYTGILHVP